MTNNTQPSMKKPYRRKDERPKELLDAALEVFVVRGYGATRLEDVAKRAGAGKGTVCAYFPTKEALFDAVIRRSLAPLISINVSQPDTAKVQLCNALRRLAIALTDFAPAATLRLATNEAVTFPNLYQIYYDKVLAPTLRSIERVISNGMANAEFTTVNPALHARLIMAPLIYEVLQGDGTAPMYSSLGVQSVFFTDYLDCALRSLTATLV